MVETAKKGNVDVLFLGDSITHGWEGAKDVWDKSFAAFKPANFGIGRSGVRPPARLMSRPRSGAEVTALASPGASAASRAWNMIRPME